MFKKLLIANRGEIACRIIRTARQMGIATVALYSDADRGALHVRQADEAIHIGASPAAESYINLERVMAAVRDSGADAVHPGYGFLSENPDFAEALAAEGVTFLGPPAAAIRAMGDKITSKKIADKAGVPTVPGHMGVVADAGEAARIAQQIGFPVMIKASAGGGGKGMRIAWNEEDAREGFDASRREAAASFGDDRIFIERFITDPRHIEIQILADSHGNCIHLGERECSIQRRNQKVIEEAPSPFLDDATRRAMGEQAVALARAVGYVSAGTVEFIVDGDRNFYFLEMNTRLQVEHPVTELVTGLDLVEQMIRIGRGEQLSVTQKDVRLNGWAIESRVYAEDPYRNFLPSIGRLSRYRPPAAGRHGKGTDAPIIRNDTGVFEGGEIPVFYDPMIAKLCTWAPTRAAAIAAMEDALDEFELEGIGHNLPFLSALMAHPRFREGRLTTAFIAEEWPEGFEGAGLAPDDLHRVIAAAAAMHHIAEIRRSRISGRIDNHERRVGSDWVAVVGGEEYPLTLAADPDGTDVRLTGDTTLRVEGGWQPGQPLARLVVDDAPLIMKVSHTTSGFHLRLRGANLDLRLYTPRQAELARLMPVKLPPDTSRQLLSPMPGLLVSLAVQEGDEVQEGQALCTVEAMKMENVLRAERRARVDRILATPGQSLAVDEVIMEFATE